LPPLKYRPGCGLESLTNAVEPLVFGLFRTKQKVRIIEIPDNRNMNITESVKNSLSFMLWKIQLSIELISGPEINVRTRERREIHEKFRTRDISPDAGKIRKIEVRLYYF